MNRLTPYWLRVATVILLSAGVTLVHADSKPDDVVSRHLDSVAAQNARATLKSRVVVGNLRFRVLVGGSGEATGTWDLVSSGRMLNVVFQFGRGEWRGEQFIFDGTKTYVAKSTQSHQYSDFGLFVSAENFILKEGLLGGALSTGWALQNLEVNQARLENQGLKKVHDRELIALQYVPKHGSDLQVKIYLDPKTYRHVLTVYSLRRSPYMTNDIRTSSAQKEVRYTLEEQFEDFETFDGFTLPKRYTLHWTEEFQDGLTREFEWQMTANQIRGDVPLDPANFEVK